MKLYYSPGACSVGIHVILEEIGKPYELSAVALKEGAQHKPDFLAVNPKAKVPALDTGEAVITEFPAIAAWLGLSNPDAKLWPAAPEQQARCLEALDYVVGNIHAQGFTRQFRPANFTPSEADQPKVVEQGKQMAAKGFSNLDATWRGEEWVLPSGYSVADAALFYTEYWAAKRSGMQLPPRLARHLDAMLARPAVQRALQQEGLSA